MVSLVYVLFMRMRDNPICLHIYFIWLMTLLRNTFFGLLLKLKDLLKIKHHNFQAVHL